MIFTYVTIYIYTKVECYSQECKRCVSYSHKYIAQATNSLKFLENLDRMQHLVSIHLRDNQIEKLDGFSANMKQVQYLNFR